MSFMKAEFQFSEYKLLKSELLGVTISTIPLDVSSSMKASQKDLLMGTNTGIQKEILARPKLSDAV